MAKYEIGIIGLGKFGYFLGQSLTDLGHTVVGIDSDPEKIKRAQDVLTQVYQADATDKAALTQLGLAELSHVIISVGHSMEASILIALHLKELGAENVWCKAVSADHEKVLKKVGVDHVVFPERFAAEQLARELVIPGLIDYLPLGKGIVLQELKVSAWAGKTLRELDLTNKYGIQVVAIKKAGEAEFEFVPKANTVLTREHILAVIGKEGAIKDLEP